MESISLRAVTAAIIAFAGALWLSVFKSHRPAGAWVSAPADRDLSAFSIGEDIGVTALGAAQITIPLFNPTDEQAEAVSLILRSPGASKNITIACITVPADARLLGRNKDGSTTWAFANHRDLRVVLDELGRLRTLSFRDEWVALVWDNAALVSVRRSKYPEVRMTYSDGLISVVQIGRRAPIFITYEEQDVPNVVRASLAECPTVSVSAIAGYVMSSGWDTSGFTISCKAEGNRDLKTIYNPRNATINRLLEFSKPNSK